MIELTILILGDSAKIAVRQRRIAETEAIGLANVAGNDTDTITMYS